MDKKEAIEFLKAKLSELRNLETLPYNNNEYPLWHRVIAGVLREVFGNNSHEYRSFVEAYPHASYMGENKQQKYLEELKMRETAILSIIQVHELVGVDTKPSTMAKPPEAPKDNEEKKQAKELELILQGTPNMLIECITNFVEKLNAKGYAYKCIPRISDAPDYTKWDKTYSASCAISQSERQIGTIKLELLPKEETLFKYSEPEDWASAFGHFLNQLFIELQRLGFKETKWRKAWRWFKEVSEVVKAWRP